MKWITTTQVLNDLKSSNDMLAWDTFCNHFRPVIVHFAKQLGLTAADAEDAAQETMVEFLKAFKNGKYDRKKGRLSSWLFGVAKRVILNFRDRQPLEHLIADKTTGTSFWELVQDDSSIGRTWESEWRQMVLTKCLEKARQEFAQKIFKAFELYALSEVPIGDVCQQLKMSRNAVYIAKYRVLSRLRVLGQQFE
jgi:RNA polymerase sigma-70 factor (ECF subfamily)